MKCSIGLFLFTFIICTIQHGTVLGFSIFGIRLWGEDPTGDNEYLWSNVKFKEDFRRTNEQFALQLMQVLEKESNNRENVFISPFSIGLALTVAMVGASGDTYTQMHRTLGFSPSLSRNQITTGYQHLLSQLSDSVAVANAIAVRPGVSLLPDYLTKLQNNFSSELFNAIDSEQINDWCNEKTHGMIRDIAPEEPSDVALVLLNAVFFNSQWETAFSRSGNKEEFYINPNEMISIRFMWITKYFAYAQFDDGELLELPYKHKNVSMFVFLPSNHINSELTVMLKHSPDALSKRISQMNSVKVYLEMPSFRFETSYNLVKHLSTLGIEDAFSSRADFGRMSDQTKLSLSSVVDKAVIEVDEEGTRAAAVTAVGLILVSAQQEPIPVILNRPFMFFIREQNNGVILFSGVVRNPQS